MGFQRSLFLILVLGPLALNGSAAAQSSPCGPPEIISPASETITESQPIIEWKPVLGAEHYRVRVQSKVPEGKTLMTFDTQVTGTQFKPPQPLTDYRARVYVQITSFCGSAQGPKTESVATGRFDIEPPVECRLAEAPKASVENDVVVIQWPALTSAGSYRVNLFYGTDARLAATHEVRDNVLKLKNTPGGIRIVVVQPRCLGRWGFPSYGAIAK